MSSSLGSDRNEQPHIQYVKVYFTFKNRSSSKNNSPASKIGKKSELINRVIDFKSEFPYTFALELIFSDN